MIHVRLREAGDVANALARFESRCARYDIPDRQHVVREVHAALSDLDRRGNELASFGSQFRAVKVIELPACSVKITACYGAPRCGLLASWLRSLLRSL
jgi:hypothetical protein